MKKRKRLEKKRKGRRKEDREFDDIGCTKSLHYILTLVTELHKCVDTMHAATATIDGSRISSKPCGNGAKERLEVSY